MKEQEMQQMEDKTKRYDLIIIGSGPAGLSAALTAKNRNLDFLLFGSRNISDKVQKAPDITNYLGIPNVTGPELAQAFLDQIDGAGIPIREERIGGIYSMGDYFSVQIGQDFVETRTVILAAGVAPAKTYPGEDELVGQGVSYCATCDAALYRGRPVLVIGGSQGEENEAAFLADFSSDVTYFPLYREEPDLPDSIRIVRERPQKISREDAKVVLETKENSYEADCVFILRQSIAPDRLVPGLSTERGHVAVNRSMETNLPGLYAAGDITGTPYQYMKAAGEGNVAAISAAGYIQQQKKEEKSA
ncbi:MAG: NAD(P)/FAD-dependent oxidoreductase [Anaerovoracaceae bacterium]